MGNQLVHQLAELLGGENEEPGGSVTWSELL